ncbi:hypothetical protein BGZ81_002177 [Podila clonocystis]|nr:hypothetical protein BGZ81_002177 [Podila clonocystis]
MANPNPLNISEILSLVASFVPVWEKSKDGLRFKPRNLLSYALVSKFWQTVVLPHVWTVYNTEQMPKILIDVLIKNSIYFRYFEVESLDTVQGFCPTPQKLWQKDPLGQPLLRCSSLKSFALTPKALPEQLELLCSNRGVVSLDWWSFSAADLPGAISDTVEPFAASLRELGVRELGGSRSAQDLVDLLVHFPKLERLRLGAKFTPLLLHNSTGITGPCIRIDDLKRLTLYESTWRDRFGALLSMFHNGASLEHVVVNMYSPLKENGTVNNSSSGNPVLNIQQAVLAWTSRESDLRVNDLFSASGMADEEGGSARLFRETHGPERLDIYIYDRTFKGEYLHAEFQHGCQDLVALKTCLDGSDPRMIIPVIASVRHLLRRVELVDVSACAWSHSSFEALSYLLGSLPELVHLKFETRSGLSKEESIAIFQGKFPEGSNGSTTDTISTTTAGWVCQHLERLEIRGLWRAYPHDHPDKKSVDIVLRSASDDHQWVACGVVEFGNKLKEVISARLRNLPALTELTLSTRLSKHWNSSSIANFEYLEIDTASGIKRRLSGVVNALDGVDIE